MDINSHTCGFCTLKLHWSVSGMQQFKAVKRQRITWTKSQKAKNKIPSHGPNKKRMAPWNYRNFVCHGRHQINYIHTYIYKTTCNSCCMRGSQRLYGHFILCRNAAAWHNTDGWLADGWLTARFTHSLPDDEQWCITLGQHMRVTGERGEASITNENKSTFICRLPLLISCFFIVWSCKRKHYAKCAFSRVPHQQWL